MHALFDLEQFVAAQDAVYAQVQQELREGRKATHWMWFIFPQLAGLGHSAMARRYAIPGMTEAQAYLGHALLGPRLIACTNLANGVKLTSARKVFGTPDDMKFHSSMTLFARARPAEPCFRLALELYFADQEDRATTGLLEEGLID